MSTESRQAFEAWFDAAPGGDWLTDPAHAAWMGWQAALSAPTPALTDEQIDAIWRATWAEAEPIIFTENCMEPLRMFAHAVVRAAIAASKPAERVTLSRLRGMAAENAAGRASEEIVEACRSSWSAADASDSEGGELA